MKTERKNRDRGVYEKHPGSGTWWIRYADVDGKTRREVAGTMGAGTNALSQAQNGGIAGSQTA